MTADECAGSVERPERDANGHVAAFKDNLRSGGSVEMFDRIAGIDPEVWRERFATPHWKDQRYYQTLEETLAEGFEQRYLVLRDAAGAILAIQPIFFVTQDLTVSLPGSVRRLVTTLRRAFPHLLRLRMLMVGCIVGDCQIGAGEHPDWPALCVALDEALALVSRLEKISLILFKDVPAGLRPALAPLRDRLGYARFPSLPAVRLPLAGYASFEDFLQRGLGKATRKGLRRKFRDLEERCADAPITLEVKNELTDAEAAELHHLYETVARRGDFQFEVFTKEYFLLLSRRMPAQAHSFIWKQAGKTVAFSFCMVTADALHDNDIGLDPTVAHDLHLYHLTFRDLFNWAVARGLKFYRSSPFNYHPKLLLRMELEPLDVYAMHRSRLVQPFLRRIAPRLEPTRQEPLLREFSNAAELWAG